MHRLETIAKMIDHSLLHPSLTDHELQEGCALAKKWGVASVCIKPYAVQQASSWLAGTGVVVGTVVGFPHGSSTMVSKAAETELACREGAREIDMVVNIGKVLSEEWEWVQMEIESLAIITHEWGGLLKVIFENDYLPDDRYKIKLCQLSAEAGADFVKTSTGYGFVKAEGSFYTYQGATDHDLQLMRQNCPATVKIKAAGGIRTLDDLLRVQALGVSRVGATATEAILQEAQKRFSVA